MPNSTIDKVNVNGTTYDITDTTSGYITGISSSDVTTALGYTPYNSTNPNNYVNATQAAAAAPVQSVNGSTGAVTVSVPTAGTTATAVGTSSSGGSATTWSKSDHVHSLSSATITSALGYTPYNSTNPNGYVDATGAANAAPVQSVNGSTGDVTISVPSAGTTATAVGTSTSGGSATTWSKSDHVHSISNSTITIALGYTPYNSTNPNGYISGISSSDVTTALGYTPYNSTNPNGYVNATGAANAAPVQSVNGSTGAVTTTDEKVQTTLLNYLDDHTTYHIVFGNGGNTETKKYDYALRYYSTDETVYLIVGSDDDRDGEIKICTGAYYGRLKIPSLSANRYYNFPNADGTVALTTNIPTAGTTATAVSTTASGGNATTWSKSDHVHSISSSTVTSALGYTPYNGSTNPNGYLTLSTLPIYDGTVVTS